MIFLSDGSDKSELFDLPENQYNKRKKHLLEGSIYGTILRKSFGSD